MEAHEVAAHGGDGKGAGAGQEVKQGLLLDGVDVLGHQAAVGKCIQNAPLIFPHVAEAPLARIDLAFMGAQVALNLLVPGLFIKSGFLHISSFS
jgi:hypothetical protein